MNNGLSKFQARVEPKVLSKPVKQTTTMGYRQQLKRSISKLNTGAGDEIRTRDFLLGKQTFCH
jgi:hypothetical protein